LFLLRVSREPGKREKGSEGVSLGRIEGLVAPEVAGRLEEDEGTRFKEASIKNNNVITF